jgi:hypothetical protein
MSSKNFYGLTGDVTVDGGILNVGNAQLYANTETSNVGIGTSNPEFELDVRGDANVHNLYATYLHGDGSNIENIVSSQWEGSPGDPIYYASNVGIANTSPVTTTMQIGSNVVVDDVGSNVLHVTGNVYATRFIGDGAFLENIASSFQAITDNGNVTTNTVEFDGSTALVTTGSVGIANTAPVHDLNVGSNLYVEDAGSNVLHVTGNIYADYFVGDGSQLTGIAASLDQIVDQGNTVSNTIQLVSGQDAISNIGLVTHDGVGISVSNTNPTGEFQFGVGSNLLVNVYSSNVLTVDGNVFAQKMTLGTVTITPAYNLQQIMATGAISNQTLVLSNVTTGLTTTSNVGIANTAPVHTLDVGSNLYVEDTGSNVLTITGNAYVTERLNVGSNLHIENLQVAEVAANLVTYDATTGELMDSAGVFSNKLAVVSEQPPIALTGASTAVTSHGTYTIEASSTSSDSSVQYLFDKDDQTVWKTDNDPLNLKYTDGGVYDANASLAGVSGEWVKITMPYKTILRHVKIESTNSSIKDVTLVGLNADGISWTTLKTVDGLNEETSTIIVNATTHHRTYGLIVEATNSGATQAEIGDLKLFTESFSIDGGKVAMASSAVMGGDTIMDQHGPHGRADVPLRKYPEIVFDASKYDQNHSTSTYVQAGYTVTASSQANDVKNAATLYDGKFPDIDTSKTAWQGKINTYDSNGDATSIDTLTGITGGVGSRNGSYTTLELPHKIKVSRLQLHTRNLTNHSSPGHPGQVYVYGSNDGSSWTQIGSHLFTSTPSGPIWQTIDINSTTLYNYFALQATSILGTTGRLSLIDLEWYGYEELATQGDTSVDTTFTSIMNTPQTTGANVYVDGNLGETFTNRVTGPDATGPPATYDATGKYWELNGSLESNIAVEANTFLSGDQPHAVSVWFNSSNLEANVSNTCVFSISDQEKLDSVNLDLQSNTWHNLTYAYQGEGGSRVTYLDGRKVAEDQAEDTFGEYPPFAMTGYAQGGYVVSASSLRPSHQAWHAFDKTKYAAGVGEKWASEASQGDTFTGGNSLYDGTNRLSSSTPYGAWLKIELPHKIRLQYISLFSDPTTEQPKDFIIYGSNDDNTWDQLFQKTGATENADYVNYTINSVSCYKYFGLVIRRLISSTTIAAIDEWKLYGHRENDLVRLPDPTNVLKYPHIAMTGPAQRGYVVTASNEDTADTYYSWKAFDNGTGTIPQVGWFTDENGNYNGANGTVTSTSTVRLAPETEKGDWLQLEFPYFFHLDYFVLYSQSDSPIVNTPDNFILYAKKNSSDTWTSLGTHTGTAAGQSAAGYTGTVDGSEVYKYFAIVVTKRFQQNSVGGISIRELEFYGTGVDSVPIQIGGGNIDKVANFRVYDKFVGEDQALEIWDAQKDAFGRAKSSMTLHKGRLGIGTTEPEGRLAVLDEPHNLEEFPPRAMQSSKVSINARTGYYDTHFEGHGTFTAYGSHEYVQPTDARVAWKAFSKQTGGNSTSFGYMNSGNHYTSGGTIYTGPESNGGKRGDFLGLKFPYKVKITHFFVMSFVTSTSSRGPKEGYLLGRINGGDWQQVHFFQNKIFKALEYTKFEFENDTFYDEYILVVTKTTGATVWNASELRYFGTREQGQSVLHDGQLTLTKSLNVPRIGPALDADDTPRRDRLVVEYNTSTNPTFEGAVRDTSGRGNDGILSGNTYYDATTKDLTFDGLGNDHIERKNIGFSGEQLVSVSTWFRYNSIPTSREDIFDVGKGGTATRLGLATYTAGTYLYTGGNDIYNTGYNLITDTSWHHIVAIYRGGTPSTTTMSLYLDNVDVTGNLNFSTASQSINFDPNDCELAVGASTTGNHTNGSISNFKLYDTALTAEEVKTLYDMGRTGHIVNPQPLHIAAPLQVEKTLGIPVDNTDTGAYTTGMIRFNQDLAKIQVHNGSVWLTLGSISGAGGTVTYADGYTIHTFTSSGTFTLYSGGYIELLVVGGGGAGGGGRHAGGGGAGAVIHATNVLVTNGDYLVTIGAGGAGAAGNIVPGNPSPSTITKDSLTLYSAQGGGYGGIHPATSIGVQHEYGKNGGCGGGAGHSTTQTATGFARLGLGLTATPAFGGNGAPGLNRAATGGGGGAGGNGTTGTGAETAQSGTGGNGGDGYQTNINGTPLYWAGGGGGSASPNTYSNDTSAQWVGGNGGKGGGGGGATGVPSEASGSSGGSGGGSALNTGSNGAKTITPNVCNGGNAGANTGGGGGGAGGWSTDGNGSGGNGGSGIVIIRYLT